MEKSVGKNAGAVMRFACRLLKGGRVYTDEEEAADDTIRHMLNGDVSLMNIGISFSDLFGLLQQHMEADAVGNDVVEIADSLMKMRSRRNVFW